MVEGGGVQFLGVLLAERTGAKIVTLPLEVGGSPRAVDYFALFDEIVDALTSALARSR